MVRLRLWAIKSGRQRNKCQVLCKGYVFMPEAIGRFSSPKPNFAAELMRIKFYSNIFLKNQFV
jgi:hypothetical protein